MLDAIGTPNRVFFVLWIIMAEESEVEEETTEEEEVFELFDIEVDTVGLVERGAVDEEFFVLKGETNMVDKEEPTQEKTEKSWLEQLGEKQAVRLIMKAVKSLVVEEQEQVEKQTPPKDKEVESMTVEKEDIQVNAQPQVDIEAELSKALEKAQEKMTTEMEAKEAELTKVFEEKQTALTEAVEKANANAALFAANAAQEREQRQRREFIEKAKDYDSLPIGADELGNYLYEVSKWDEGANVELAKSKDHKPEDNQGNLEFLNALLKAANEQIKESKFYAEAGSSHIPEPEKGGIVEKAQALMKENEGMTLDEAMLQLPAEFVAKHR